jgi:hypothetical protein
MQLELGLPFSWQLLWLSSLFFLVALAIYHIRCPAFIKRYNQYTEYKSYSHDPRWLAWEARDVVADPKLLPKFVERLSTKKFLQELPPRFKWDPKNNPAVEEHATRLFFRHAGQTYALAMPLLDAQGNELPDAERGIFWEIFGRFSSSRTLSRLLILILLSLSGVLFVLVLMDHVWFGIQQLWEWVKAVFPFLR